MQRLKAFLIVFVIIIFPISSVCGVSVAVQLSGPGAVDDSTIMADTMVSIDIWLENDTVFTGFTFGFILTSSDIRNIVHVSDSMGGLNPTGDIKGHNGWDDSTVWDLKGVIVREIDWDGVLPETIGFGGLCIRQRYTSHNLEKKLSFDLKFSEPGTIVIDSSFFPPGGVWLFTAPERIGVSMLPEWGGPYTFRVIK